MSSVALLTGPTRSAQVVPRAACKQLTHALLAVVPLRITVNR